MKKHILLSLFAALILMVVNPMVGMAQYAGTGTFTKITSLTDLTDGYYVITDTDDGFAMNSTNAGTYFTHTAITPSSGVITDPIAAIVWEIKTNNTGRTIYSQVTDKYASYTGSSNAAQAVTSVAGDNQRWTFSYVTGKFKAVNMAINTRYLQYNTSAPHFACYTGSQKDLQLYKLDPPASGKEITVTQETGGTIAPGTTTVPVGDDQDFTATPDACYTFTNWLVDNSITSTDNPYIFTNVTAAHTLTAVYTAVTTTNDIVATAGANGSISPAGTTTLSCGANQTYTITPDAGFAVEDVLVDGVSQGPITSYDFTDVDAPHTISVTFVAGPCYTEDFSALPSSNSYTTRTWAGAGGTWEAEDAKTDQNLNGKAITLRNQDLTSPSFPDVISSITISTKKPHSDSDGSLTVKLNGVVIGTIPYTSSITTTTLPVTGATAPGVLVIEGNGARVTIDDIEIFCGPALNTVNLSIDPSSGSENTPTQDLTLTATADFAVVGDQTITIGLSGSATAADFTAVPTTITILNGQIAGSAATFKVVDDALNEGTETAIFTIAGITSSGTPATIGTTSSVDFEIEDNDVPVIIATPTSLSGFSTPQGTPSASQSFTLEGDNLTGDLTIEAVSGYGYSLDNIAFVNTLTVPVVGGNVENEPRTIYVRLTGASIGTPSGTAIISGGGATAVDVALNGEVSVPPLAACSELFISEYHEAESGNEKYIEIYNPTSSAVTLTGVYDLVQYNNGSTSVSYTLNLTGSIPGYGNIYVANNLATLKLGALVTDASVMGFNGNDVIALRKNSTNIDVIGTIGSSANFAVDVDLRRLPTVNAPVTTYNSSEWSSIPSNNVTNIGTYLNNCTVSNPVVTLSTNTTTATEADATQIVLTASTDVAVTGTQTVAVVLTGTGLTTSDFTGQTFPAAPAGLIITIPSGATSGTLTFNVANDTDVEGTETATFTLGSPSGGIVVGTPNQVSVTIDDNDNVTSTESVIIEQGGEATGISSLSNGTITNNTEGTQVWAFNLYDGDGTNNDVDDKPTIYTKWVIRPDGLNNTVPNWDNAIYRVAFFSGTTLITGATLINPANISFVPSTPITVADGTMPVEITMRITLENTLPAGSDGQHFAFGLDNITNPADVTVDTDVLVSSQLGTFTQVSDAALNGIDIVATLQFIDAPAAVSVGSNFSVTVSAVDANGNVDMNVSNSITLSLTNGTGTLTGTPFTANLVNGTYIFTGLNHDTEEVIEITVHDNANVFANLTANINVTDESHQLFDDFNRADSYTVGVPSSGGSTAWTEDESGDGSKARIENNQLLLTNCNSNGTGGNQYMEQVMFNVDSRYETVYDNAGSSMEWLFNMKQSRSDPSGFNNGNFAAGVILGSNQLDVDVAGADGYGVILGNQNEDQIRLIRFNNGLTSNLNITVIAQTLDVAPLNHFSVKVTYDPCTGDWKLSARDDGSSFTAPNVGSLGAEFSGNDQTYTALDLKYFGLLWNHNNSCGETALFDNVNIPNATSASTTAKVWNGSVNDNWNEANNWGPCPGVPTLTDNVEIPNVATQPIVSAATPVAVCNNLTVNAGATLTINSTRQLTADGNVTNNGTVYVNDGGSFIQTQNGTAAHAGTGNFVVQRQAVGGFNAWSTPVVNGTLPGSNGYWYDSTEGTSDPTDDNAPDPDPGWFPHSGAMTSGQGYYAINAGLATFTGKANNGTVTYGITQETAATPDLKGTRYNLVGNPYPSAISADQFITDNSGVIDGSIYFWDDDNTGPGNYTLDDYATYTKTGVVPNLTEGGSNGSGPTPNGNIGSAQGFFVSCTNSGNITFNNAQRGGSNIQFFRMAAPTTQRLWLSINNEALQLFNQTLVAFDEFATDQKDWGMDALKFRGNAAVSIGAIQDNETYVIATYESIPQLGKIIPLMTYVEASATYTFVADTMEGFDNHHVYLEDLSNGLLYPLTQGDAYSFAITSADEYNRFQLWFSPMVITGVNEAENEFSIYATQNNAIVVKTTSTEPVNGTVQITDMAGRIIFNNDISVINGIGKIQTTGIANGIYAITFATTDGSRSTSQKVALSR